MRHSLALAVVLFAACGSDPLTPPRSDDHDAGETAAGAAGEGNDGAGVGGESGEGSAGVAGAASGQPGASGEAGQAGAPHAPLIGYRVAGIAYGSFPRSDGGASGAGNGAGQGGSTGGESSETDDGGSAGAPAALPPIERAECNFYLDFVDVIEDGMGGFDAFAYGEVFRNVYSGEQRWEFSAFVAGLASFSVNDDGSAELRAFGDQTGAKPFWLEIEVLHGTRNANGTSGGPWSCASLELFEPGFPDASGTATGTWLLVPVNGTD